MQQQQDSAHAQVDEFELEEPPTLRWARPPLPEEDKNEESAAPGTPASNAGE